MRIVILSASCGPVARGGCARAPTLVPRSAFQAAGSAILAAQEHISGCPGAQLSITWVRLPGSTLQGAWEHTSGCLGAHFRLRGSTRQVDWGHAPGCLAARSRLPGSTLQVARGEVSACPGAQLSITWVRLSGGTFQWAREVSRRRPNRDFPNYGRTEFTKALPRRGFMKLR